MDCKLSSSLGGFAEESVYGKRDGSISGLAIISRDSRNIFKGTKGFKTGTVHGVQMLQRSDMFKPEQADLGLEFGSTTNQQVSVSNHS